MQMNKQRIEIYVSKQDLPTSNRTLKEALRTENKNKNAQK